MADTMTVEGGLADLKIVQSEAELEVKFEPRLWSLVHEVPRLYEALLTNLSACQLSAGDIRTEGNGTVGGTSLAFWLFGFNVTVTVKLDAFTVRCTNLRTVSREQLVQLLDGLKTALQQATRDTFTILGTTVSYTGHGETAGIAGRDIVRRFVTGSPAVAGFGAGTGAGAAFYFADAPPLISSALTVDLSRVVADGIFLRLVLVTTPIESSGDLIDVAMGRVTAVFTALDLQETTP